MSRRLFFRLKVSRGYGNPVLAAAVGIALSLIPLITVEHVAEAMIEGIATRYREIATFHFQIHNWRIIGKNEWAAMEQKTLSLDSVKNVWLERRGWGLAQNEFGRAGIIIRALPADMPVRDSLFGKYLDFDEGIWSLEQPDSIILGREVARQLRSSVGEYVRILTIRKLPNGTQVPRVVKFKVQGIFTSGYKDLDANWVFISLRQGWQILSPENTQTFLGGKLIDSSLGLDEISSMLPEKWRAFHWKTINAGLLANLESTRVILLIIMGLVVVVAIFNILNSLFMLALERRREIGILKCFGVRNSTITLTFMQVGAIAAILGCIAGVLLGVTISYFINQLISAIEQVYNFFFFSSDARIKILAEGHYLQYIPVRINWVFVGIASVLTIFVCILASAAPAVKAARLKPLEILRRH